MNPLMALAMSGHVGEAGVTYDDVFGVGSGIIAQYKLTSGGLLVDSSPNNLDLSNVGTLGNVSGFNGGANKACGVFNTGKYLKRVDAAAYDFSGGLTIAAWVKTSNIVATNSIACQMSPVGDHSYWFTVNPAVRGMVSFNGAAQNYFGTGSPVSVNTWHHTAITFDGFNARTYLDGVLQDTTAMVGTVHDSTKEHRLGVRGELNTHPLFGSLDDVGYWGRALSGDEIVFLATMNEDFT